MQDMIHDDLLQASFCTQRSSHLAVLGPHVVR